MTASRFVFDSGTGDPSPTFYGMVFNGGTGNRKNYVRDGGPVPYVLRDGFYRMEREIEKISVGDGFPVPQTDRS